MKKTGILNKQLSGVVAGLGQSDIIVVCDAGLPLPEECIHVDLALTEGIPGFFDVLDILFKEIIVDRVILASEVKERSSAFHNEVLKKVTGMKPEYMTHEAFKVMCKSAKAVVRTGEFTPYANIALVCGSI